MVGERQKQTVRALLPPTLGATAQGMGTPAGPAGSQRKETEQRLQDTQVGSLQSRVLVKIAEPLSSAKGCPGTLGQVQSVPVGGGQAENYPDRLEHSDP